MENIRVLFIGNSHTFFNDMPQVFARLCEDSGTAHVEATMQAHPGVHLSWHLKQRFELRYALVHGKYDYVVFQQAAHPCPDKEETIADGKELISLIRAVGAEPIATVTWAERRFPENQEKMYDIFDTLAKETGVKLSPAGQVFERCEGKEDIDLYFFDGEHCSPYGSYAVAACAFAQIFGKTPVGLPAVSINNIGGTAEDYASLSKKRAELAADPENVELQAAIAKLAQKSFSTILERDKLWVDLDPKKTARLQEIIAEETKN